MDDVANAASNAVSEPVSVVQPNPASTPAPSAPESNKPVTTSEALDRAFEKTDLFVEEDKPTGDGKQPRAPDGKFAPKTADTPVAAKATETPAVTPDPAQTPAARPAPSRLSKAAQEAWANAPEIVRQDVERILAEQEAGITKYRTDFAALKPYADRAKAQGTSVDKLFEGYVSWESAFKRDPIAAFSHMLRNAGIDPASAAQALAGGATAQPSAGGDSAEVIALKQQLAALSQQVGGFSQKFQEIETRPVVERVTEFSKNAPFFDLLANDVAEQLRAQPEDVRDLQAAYDAALAKYPDLQAVVAAKKTAGVTTAQTSAPATAQTRAPSVTPTPAAHTDKAKLSITGSPSGSDPATRKQAGSTRAALDSAFAQVGL